MWDCILGELVDPVKIFDESTWIGSWTQDDCLGIRHTKLDSLHRT
jgi:hypothetical protein